MQPRLPPVRFSPHFPALAAAILNLGRDAVGEGAWVQGGEAALAVALQLMVRRHSNRRHVVAPDFVCPAVPRAIRAAGFEPILAPLDPHTWFYRRTGFEEILSDDTAAVVTVAYHGMIPLLPDWFDGVLECHHIPALADWASCFGVELHSYGRAPLAIFSFGPGKSMPAGGGGLILPLNDEGRDMLAQAPPVAPAGVVASGLHLVRLLLQSVAVSSVTWPLIPQSVARAASGGERDEKQMSGLAPAWVGRYAAKAARALSEEIHRRRAVCRELTERLKEVELLTLPSAGLIDTGACVRYPVLLETPVLFERVRGALLAKGLLKGGYTWDMHAAGSGGQAIAARLLTLPTHCGNHRILDCIAECIRATVGR